MGMEEVYDVREIVSLIAGIGAILISVLTYLLKNGLIQFTSVYFSDEQLLLVNMGFLFVAGIILCIDTVHPKQKSRW